MDRLDAMHAFVLAADEGSLAAAARRLRRSPAAITRAIALLEARVGTSLFNRTTRALRLTPAGETYLATCRQVLADLDAAERAAGSEQGVLRGTLTVTSPATFGRLHVRPVVDRFLAAHPDIRIRLLLVDRVTNLLEEGIDAAIRIGELPDSGLTAIRLGEMRRVICASPAYLATHPPVMRPQDLAEHDGIVFSRDSAEAAWSLTEEGRRRPVRPRPRLAVNDAVAAVASAVDGHGITQVLAYQAEAELTDGRLVRLLGGFEPPPLPVHIVTPMARPLVARLRAFTDLAVPALKTVLLRVAAQTA